MALASGCWGAHSTTLSDGVYSSEKRRYTVRRSALFGLCSGAVKLDLGFVIELPAGVCSAVQEDYFSFGCRKNRISFGCRTEFHTIPPSVSPTNTLDRILRVGRISYSASRNAARKKKRTIRYAYRPWTKRKKRTIRYAYRPWIPICGQTKTVRKTIHPVYQPNEHLR